MLREYEGMTIHDAFRSFEKETKNIIKKYSTNG